MIRSALRNLGFRAAESSTAAAQAIAHVGVGGTIEDLMRAALRACWSANGTSRRNP